MKSLDELKKEWMKDEEFAKAYDLKQTLRVFIRNIRSARAEKGLTQKDLAKAVGTSQSVIARIEAGKQNVSYEMMYRLSAALGLRLQIHATNDEVVTVPQELSSKFREIIGADQPDATTDIVSNLLKSVVEVHEELTRDPESVEKISEALGQIGDAYRINPIDALRYVLMLGGAQWEKLVPEHKPVQRERCDEECLAG